MRTPETCDLIFLADNEWGNQIMREVAEEHFRLNPDCFFVVVYEHAGWELCFHRSGEVVGTANGSAVMRRDRPMPKSYSNCQIRREVIRPDILEVDTLAMYGSPQPMEA